MRYAVVALAMLLAGVSVAPTPGALAASSETDALVKTLKRIERQNEAAVRRAVAGFRLAFGETRLSIVENDWKRVTLALQYHYSALILPATRVAAAERVLTLCRRLAMTLGPSAQSRALDVVAVDPPGPGWRGAPLFGAIFIAVAHLGDSDCALGPSP